MFVAGCETETPLGPGPTAPIAAYRPGTGEVFNEHDFTWSRATGGGGVDGVLNFRTDDGETYTCRGRDVILIPDTPWVRRRMFILYGSTSGSAAPADIVRARTPSAGAGDYASYARKTVCDASNRFSFRGLPDGGWYVITLARPADGSEGTMAIMRRIETRGVPRPLVLN
jgi:hypothetical protein